MLQRIQSVLLLFAALCMLAILFRPVWIKSYEEKNETLTLTAIELVHEKMDIETGAVQVINKDMIPYMAILAVLSAAVAFYSIFRYDNRLLQMKLGAFNSLLMGGSLGVAVYFSLQAEKILEPMARGTYVDGFYLGVAALLLNSIANRFIRKDEKLVRSADRIR